MLAYLYLTPLLAILLKIKRQKAEILSYMGHVIGPVIAAFAARAIQKKGPT
jgi:hypothetical protein